MHADHHVHVEFCIHACRHLQTEIILRNQAHWPAHAWFKTSPDKQSSVEFASNTYPVLYLAMDKIIQTT